MQMNWAGSLYSSNSLGDGEIDKRRSCTQLDGVCVFFFPAYFGIASENTHTNWTFGKSQTPWKKKKEVTGLKKKTNSRSACRDERVRAAYNRGKPPCVCVCIFLLFVSPHLRLETFLRHTHTHGPRSQKAAYAYTSCFFFFLSLSLSLPFLSFF